MVITVLPPIYIKTEPTLLEIAGESLYLKWKNKDIAVYSDNGNFEALCYFRELCAANATKIKEEQQQHLKR